ncbi:fungal-specific transcription factor domain-containing protein [Xylariaceae sp. FL0016]|nr:fungal-specific transcription factor domain-containing protein [Xylariaceae sp. FL0016]
MSSDRQSSMYTRFRVNRAPADTDDSPDPTIMPSAGPRSASPADNSSGSLQQQHLQQQQHQQLQQLQQTQPPPPLKPKSVPACDRCRSFKKKCSRTFPVCSLCASAGQKCSFSTPASSSAAQTHHLRARVNWLSQYINQSLPVNIEAIETGTDLTHLFQGSSPLSHGVPGVASPTSPVSGHDAANDDHPMADRPGGSVEVNPDNISVSSRSHHSVSHVSAASERVGEVALASNIINATTPRLPPLPPDAAARRFVTAFFRNVHRAYPFLDRSRVLQDLETFGEFARHRRASESTVLYLIMAIGCTTLQRAGQVPNDTTSKFEVNYSDIIQECLCSESIESIQILVLLALYSLFDPTVPAGASAFSLVGFVARRAVFLGLTRRASDDETLSATEVELRHRLFWSIFVLDRMIATSLGQPVALTDDNMVDVPLPGLTVDEFTSDRAHFAGILQTSRHVIQLRQMEGRILQQVHQRKQSEVDRRTIIRNARQSVEDWYSNGCLVSPLEPDNVPIHSSITWLSARYYFLLLLLYYPSQFNAFGPLISRAELLRFAQRHLQSTSALFQQRQLPLNRVTLCRLLPVGLVLMHGFVVACAPSVSVSAGNGCDDNSSCSPFPARDEVAVLVSILEAFPDAWVHAHQAARVFRQFLAVVNSAAASGAGGGSAALHHHHFAQGGAAYGHHHHQMGGGGGGASSSSKDAYQSIRPHLAALLALMRDALGKASCYIPDERDLAASAATGSFFGVPPPPQQPPLATPVPSNRNSLSAAVGVLGTEDASMAYGWGPLELDFL